MKLRRAAVAVIAVGVVAVGATGATGAALPAEIVGQAAPTLVPHSTLPGAGAFEGPVHRLAVDGIEIGYRQFGHGPDLIMVTGDTAPMSLWRPGADPSPPSGRPLARSLNRGRPLARWTGRRTTTPSTAGP